VLADFVLRGAIAPADVGALDDLETLARERYLHARIRRGALALRPDGDGWMDALPPGVPRSVAAELARRVRAGEGAALARAALDELYRMHRGVAR
jgi:hypothetical protein